MDGPEAGLELLDALDRVERPFVMALLAGGTFNDACRAANIGSTRSPVRESLAVCRLLGRPKVQAALETLVPLAPLPDARVIEILRPYLRAKLVAATTGKSPVTALRDLLSLGKQDVGDDPMRAWMAAQERRARASTSEQVQAAAPGGMGDSPPPASDSRLPQ